MLCKVMMLVSDSNTNILQIYLDHSMSHTSILYDMYICVYLPSVHSLQKTKPTQTKPSKIKFLLST